jgi:hypothetical protein
MMFLNYKGVEFNSIELEHLKDRMGLSARIFAFGIEQDGKYYIIGSSEGRRKCVKKARNFAEIYKVDLIIFYLARESDEEFIQEIVGYVNPSKPNNQKKKRKHKCYSDVQYQNKKRIISIDLSEAVDETVSSAQENYLKMLKNNK